MKDLFTGAFHRLCVNLLFSGLAGLQMPGNGRLGKASIAEAAGST